MNKRLIFLSIFILSFTALLLSDRQTVAAAGMDAVKIQILSPAKVKNYPGYETKVKVKITNQTGNNVSKAMVYITMADLGKHWTVNLEDYSADQPIRIKTLAPGQSINVSLPIRFVYTSHYKLYVTVSSDQNLAIYSSNAIPVTILGNTKIDPTLVTLIAIIEPFILLLLLMYTLFRRKFSRA